MRGVPNNFATGSQVSAGPDRQPLGCGRLSQGKFDYRSLSDEQVRSLYQSMLASEPSPGTADHVGRIGEMEEIFNRLFPETGKDQ